MVITFPLFTHSYRSWKSSQITHLSLSVPNPCPWPSLVPFPCHSHTLRPSWPLAPYRLAQCTSTIIISHPLDRGPCKTGDLLLTPSIIQYPALEGAQWPPQRRHKIREDQLPLPPDQLRWVNTSSSLATLCMVTKDSQPWAMWSMERVLWLCTYYNIVNISDSAVMVGSPPTPYSHNYVCPHRKLARCTCTVVNHTMYYHAVYYTIPADMILYTIICGCRARQLLPKRTSPHQYRTHSRT